MNVGEGSDIDFISVLLEILPYYPIGIQLEGQVGRIIKKQIASYNLINILIEKNTERRLELFYFLRRRFLSVGIVFIVLLALKEYLAIIGMQQKGRYFEMEPVPNHHACASDQLCALFIALILYTFQKLRQLMIQTESFLKVY